MKKRVEIKPVIVNRTVMIIVMRIYTTRLLKMEVNNKYTITKILNISCGNKVCVSVVVMKYMSLW